MDRIYFSKQELCQFQVYVLIHISPAGNKFMKAPLSRGFIKTQKKKVAESEGTRVCFSLHNFSLQNGDSLHQTYLNTQ